MRLFLLTGMVALYVNLPHLIASPYADIRQTANYAFISFTNDGIEQLVEQVKNCYSHAADQPFDMMERCTAFDYSAFYLSDFYEITSTPVVEWTEGFVERIADNYQHFDYPLKEGSLSRIVATVSDVITQGILGSNYMPPVWSITTADVSSPVIIVSTNYGGLAFTCDVRSMKVVVGIERQIPAILEPRAIDEIKVRLIVDGEDIVNQPWPSKLAGRARQMVMAVSPRQIDSIIAGRSLSVSLDGIEYAPLEVRPIKEMIARALRDCR